MSKKTKIYVLFKEYPDPNGRGKSGPYIQDSTDYLVHQDALMSDWRAVADVLNYFEYEIADRYYNDDNLTGLLRVADTFPAEYPFVADTIRAEMQTIGLTTWKSNAAQKTDTFFLGQHDVTDDLLGDMAQRDSHSNGTEPCVLLHRGAVATVNGEIMITMKGNRCLKLRSVDNVRDMHAWLSDHRFPRRNYVFNEKHGDAHHKAQTYTNRHGHVELAAQLLTTAAATQQLLNLAVGETTQGDVWYFDQTNGCYIYFENQGNNPQHEYHAYHLHPGEKNYDKIGFAKVGAVVP